MNKDSVNILVLGVGGNVGQGIVKALRLSDLNVTIFGSCVSPYSAGLYLCDHSLISPFATDDVFLTWLIETCNKYSIAGVLCGVEEVLVVLAKNREYIESSSKAKVVVADSKIIELCLDKYITADWLQKRNIGGPTSCVGNDTSGLQELIQSVGFPLIAKPRQGKGSIGIVQIKSNQEFTEEICTDNYVIQEYLGDADHEYTVSTFTDSRFNIRGLISFRRKLAFGTTVFAVVVDDSVLSAKVRHIVNELQIVGPCNVQLRYRGDEPVAFEINARFSGTTPIRAHYGFNDVSASVAHLVIGHDAVDLPLVTKGVAFRIWDEVYTDSLVGPL